MSKIRTIIENILYEGDKKIFDKEYNAVFRGENDKLYFDVIIKQDKELSKIWNKRVIIETLWMNLVFGTTINTLKKERQ